MTSAPTRALLVDRGRLLRGGWGIDATGVGGPSPSELPQLAPEAEVTALLRVGPRLVAGVADGLLGVGPAVLQSTDDGRTWTDATEGLVDAEVLALAASADRTTLYAGTRHGGVHALRLPDPVRPAPVDDDVVVTVGGRAEVDVLADDAGGDAEPDRDSLTVRTGTGDWAASASADGVTVRVAGDGRVAVTDEGGAPGRRVDFGYRFTTAVGDEGVGRLTVRVVDDDDAGGTGGAGGAGDAGGAGGSDGSGDADGSGAGGGGTVEQGEEWIVDDDGTARPGRRVLAFTGADSVWAALLSVVVVVGGGVVAARARRRP